MIKYFYFIVALVLLSSCNNSLKDERQKSSTDTTKTSFAENTLDTTISSKKAALERDVFPFDSIIRNCMHTPTKSGWSKGGTTDGMVDCYYNSADKLETLINNIYNKLYSKLDNEDRLKLSLSQNRWKKFYLAEGDFLFSAFYTWANARKYGHGREHAITQAEWRYDIVRQRLIDLTKYDKEIYEEEIY